MEGNKIKEKYEGDDVEKVALELRKKGYYLTGYKKNSSMLEGVFFKKAKLDDLSLFCSELSTLITAGITISESLDIIFSQQSNKYLKRSLQNINKKILQGEELHSSLRQYPDIYPLFLIEMIHIGEESGNLQAVLKNLSNYYQNQNRIYKKVTTALTYPLFVLITFVIIAAILFTRVLPTFAGTLTSIGGELPFITKLILVISNFLMKNTFVIILLISIACILVVLNVKKNNSLIFKFQLKIPLISDIYKKSITCKFSSALRILISSGLTLVNSLEMVEKIFPNQIIKDEIENSIKSIGNGNSLYVSLKLCKFFSVDFLSLIRIGEESGKLESILMDASKIYDNDVNQFLERIVKIIEPALIILLSVFIGIIVFAVLQPMLNIMDKLG